MRRPRRIERREPLALPDARELFDCRWRVAGKMIIGEGVDENASFSDLVAKIDPAAQFGCTVNDCFVPGHGLLLDCFTVAEPADVRPTSSNRIELKFGRTLHPGTILEHECYATIPEQSRKFCVKPISIAKLNREFVRIREPCEEWNKTVQKLVTIVKS